MNDFELESKLKSVPLPERSENYWENFPLQTRLQLRRGPREFEPANLWCLHLARAAGVALAVVLGFVCVQFQPLKNTSVAISKHEKHLHMEFAQFETKLRFFMQDEHGMHYLIAEKE